MLAFVSVAHAQQPPAVVSTTVAHATNWQDRLQAVGTIRAVRGADLAAEVSGVVDTVDFDSGRDVAAGTVLLRLRPNDDEARLADLQAAAQLAAENLARDTKQFHAQAVSQASMDADESHLLSARAQVAQQQALMAEKIVRAPFAGRLGLRLVDQGQYLAAGTTIVTLQALDPLFVDFYLPQQALGQVVVGLTVAVTLDAYPGRSFPGNVTALNARVDATSRMLQVRASVANPDGALLPGMFASVTADAGAPRKLVTVPLAAVSYNPYGSLVYVVRQDHDRSVVKQQFVTTGAARGDQVSILKGLAANDVVVTEGQLKLHNDAAVKIDNAVRMSDAAAPAIPQDR
jgi:membrane fusion protein (multidrug efflux system)